MNFRIALLATPILLTSLACDPPEPADDGVGDDEEGDEGDEGDEGNPPSDEGEPEPVCLPTDQPYIGNLYLDSNDDVEVLAGYSVVEGNIKVLWGVTDLSALTCLTETTGAIWIVDNQVASLEPLANLVTVGAELELGMLHVLTDITLPSLEQVGWLSVYMNENLTNLDMPQLDGVNGVAEIGDNLNLPTCDVTTIRDALTYLGEMFYIGENGQDECVGN
jgi:hypothetical protein